MDTTAASLAMNAHLDQPAAFAPTDFDLSAMRAAAGNATKFLRSVANEDRLMLLCQLTEGERCVSDLEAETGITQPTLSQQLAVLRNEGLVTTRRDGKFIYYTLGDERVHAMLAALHGMFCKNKIKAAAALQAS
jgi:DNA-binding transcriptional ArsR family regulator